MGSSAIAALALGLASPAFAQDEGTGDETVELATVAVWGTHVSSDSLYLGEQEIELKQADHLSDLMRVLPGVDIGGTHSINTRINFRGLDDRNLSIFIDGAQQKNYLFHHIGNLLINPDILQSAEIQLGTNTVTHGGLGGSVRFETKDARDLLAGTDRDFGARLALGYNTNALNSQSATAYGQLGERVDGLIYYNRVDRDNFEDGNGRETVGSDGETEDVLAKLGFAIADNQRLEVSYDYLSDAGDYTQRPDMGAVLNQALTGDLVLPTEYSRETINVSYDLDLGPAFALDATYFTNDMDLYRDERAATTRTGPGRQKRAIADNQGVNLLARSDIGFGGLDHQLTYGVEYFDQSFDYDGDIELAGGEITQSSDYTAIFIEDAIGLTRQLTVRPGVRYTDYSISYDTAGSSGSFDEVSYGLAADFKVNDALTLLASHTDLFQGPELAEPFTGAGGNKLVNPDLAAETGHAREFGVRFSVPFDAGQLNLGANLFRTEINDFIAEQAVTGSTTGATQDVNIGDAVIDGAEASANLAFDNWSALLTYATSNMDIDGAAPDDSFREIGDQVSYELSRSFHDGDLTIAVNGLFVMDKQTLSGDIKQDYNVHNLTARWDGAFGIDGLSTTFGIDNLFDKAYTSHASRTGIISNFFTPDPDDLLELNDVEPGRNIKITLAKTF